ncbi:MAG: hypothetical protein CR988_07420 [Treponema sp.]|nr:MAG: hypothetical protein CR988_07420 [Treponema sp.]
MKCFSVKLFSVLLFVFLLFPIQVFCEDDSEIDRVSEPYTKDEFPLWQREIRRFEILTFGALPFVTMLSFWTYDISRSIKYSGDPRYYPWSMKNANISVSLTQDEQIKIFGTAVGISLGIALFDVCYRAIKRDIEAKKLERENLIQEEPIQIIPIITDEAGVKLPSEEEAGE